MRQSCVRRGFVGWALAGAMAWAVGLGGLVLPASTASAIDAAEEDAGGSLMMQMNAWSNGA